MKENPQAHLTICSPGSTDFHLAAAIFKVVGWMCWGWVVGCRYMYSIFYFYCFWYFGLHVQCLLPSEYASSLIACKIKSCRCSLPLLV